MGSSATSLVFLAALATLAPSPASAWTSGTHERIAAAALAALPPPMRSFLEPSLGDLRAGSVRPDFIAGDDAHHLYCLEDSCGDAPDHLAAQYERLLADFRRPGRRGPLLSTIALLFPAGCSSPGAAGPDGTGTLAFRLGVLAHYLADVCVPYHTVPYVEPAKSRHLRFELEVEGNFDRVALALDGRTDDIGPTLREYAIGLARAARTDLAVVDDPAESHGSDRYRAAVDSSCSCAVNAVADLWFAVLTRVQAAD